jgi:hypothetical protein
MDFVYEAVLANGTELQLDLEQLDHELYRVTGAAGLILPRPGDGGTVPKDAGMGWLVDAERLDELRILVRAVRPDPEADGVMSVVPHDFTRSDPFRALGREIMAAGGNWEVIMMGLFSAWVPRARFRGGRISLEHALGVACAQWREPWRFVAEDGDA